VLLQLDDSGVASAGQIAFQNCRDLLERVAGYSGDFGDGRASLRQRRNCRSSQIVKVQI
jgi:hypothetical protein